MSTVSTHVLDSATGLPAAGMAVTLEMSDPSGWLALGEGVTDPDGRLKDWDVSVHPGDHRLIFQTGSWFAEQHRECFYPEVIITFTVNDDGSHFHVPLLLAAYAYSTYRGS